MNRKSSQQEQFDPITSMCVLYEEKLHWQVTKWFDKRQNREIRVTNLTHKSLFKENYCNHLHTTKSHDNIQFSREFLDFAVFFI